MFVNIAAIIVVILFIVVTAFVLPKLIARLIISVRSRGASTNSQADKDAKRKLENRIGLILDLLLLIIALSREGIEAYTTNGFHMTEKFRNYLQSISLSILIAGLFTLTLGFWHSKKGFAEYAEPSVRMKKLRRSAIIGIVISAVFYFLSLIK
jgi:hypothetical protein